MPYTGEEDHSISLNDAVEMTKNYRESISSTPYLWAAYFGKQALKAILDQEECVGIRIYNAKSASNSLNYVLVGVNSSGEDLEDGELAEHGLGCPPYCAPDSNLAGTT